MTLEGARATAAGMAKRFGKTFLVYRFEAWPPDTWSVIAENRSDTVVGLPREAVVERFEDLEAGSSPTPTPKRSRKAPISSTPGAGAEAGSSQVQGGLF